MRDFPILDFNSRFYKNCKTNRKKKAKICDVCPFRQGIEEQEQKRDTIKDRTIGEQMKRDFITVKWLRDKLTEVIESCPEVADHPVCIANHKPSVGPRSVTFVTGYGSGFDWDSGKMFLYTEKDMMEKPLQDSKCYKCVEEEYKKRKEGK
jgi:hypothetical protein